MNRVAFACKAVSPSLNRLLQSVAPTTPTYPTVDTPGLVAALDSLDLLVTDDPERLNNVASMQREAIAGLKVLCVSRAMDAHVGQLSETLKRYGATPILRQSDAGVTNAVLRDLEMECLRRWMAVDGYHALLGHGPRDGGHVMMVGAGIVNLVTAWTLVTNGFSVTLLERSPDPRRASGDWRGYGCTYGGANARIFSLNESRNHTLKFAPMASGGAVLSNFFDQRVEDGGWLARPNLTAEEKSWTSRHNGGNRWMMEVYEEDILGFNRESENIWQSLQTQHPELFNNTNIRQGILRLYATEEQWKNAILKETQIGALVRVITAEQLCSEQPALLPSIMTGGIAGAIEVKGFSLGVQNLACNLISALEARGATLRFDTEAIAFEHSGEEVSGIQTANGVLRADHYVVCPGAYGENLMADLGIDNQIHSVLGAWYKLRNEAPRLNTSIKYSRAGLYADGAAEGANIVLGEEQGEGVIWVSSGHAYIGKDAHSAEPEEIERIFLGVRDTVRALFPRQFLEIELSGGFLKQDIRYCVRPWARECLGIFATIPAVNGKVVVTGGHNTGGFAQAPSVGQAVLNCLRGREHPMHRFYHPWRSVIFEDALARREEIATAHTLWHRRGVSGEMSRRGKTGPRRGTS